MAASRQLFFQKSFAGSVTNAGGFRYGKVKGSDFANAERCRKQKKTIPMQKHRSPKQTASRLLATLLLGALSASAITPPARPQLENFDRRSAAAALPLAPAAAVLATDARGVRVDRDPVTGGAEFVGSPAGLLTAPLAAGAAVDHAKIARDFLDRNRGVFGHGSGALKESRMLRDYTSESNGVRTMVWQQELDGVRVFEATLQAHVTAKGALVNIASKLVPDPAAAAKLNAAQRAARLARPAIGARQAVVLSGKNLGQEMAEAQVAEGDTPAGAERKQSFRSRALTGVSAALCWLPIKAGELRLCWEVIAVVKRRGEMYRVLIDAQTGEALVRHSLTNYISDASYRVFTSDSPSPFSPGHPTPLSTQPPVVARTLVTTPALNTTASPNGWIDDGVNETRGNNVDAHTDLTDDDVADTPRPQGSPNRVFDFPLDLAQEPATYRNAAVTQLFYLNNWMHDKLYALGFTEAAGNFQNNNFGRGGAGNDAVQADAQDGSALTPPNTSNANFSTPPDGTPGRMQMYVFDDPAPDRDGSFDAEIVLHEYAHGLSNRLVGGGVGISALQTGGMGEGWSDFYGLALLSEAGDNPGGNYAAGGYATWQLGGMTTNYYYGIRRYPYSTDLTKNPLTFKDIDPAQASAHTGIPRSPIIGNSAGEVHNQGEVWCVTLWEARAGLIAKHGFATGSQLILQLVTDGMKLAPANPNFLQARDAIIQADLVATGGANRLELWTAFAKRGMGASASSPASSTTGGVVEAFDLPDDLSVTPGAGFTSSGPVGGPFNLTTLAFTLRNNGAAPLNWTATHTAAWLSLSATGGTLTPGATTTVTASLNAAAKTLAAAIYNDPVVFHNAISGAALTRSFVLRVGQPDFFTELFDDTPNDTAGQSFTFTPNGSPSFYAATRAVVSAFPTDPAGGTVLSQGDDTSVAVTLAGGASAKLYGTSYASFNVGSNGYITFGAADFEFVPSLAQHFAFKRIAALFRDLDFSAQGTCTWRQLADRAAVTWQNAPAYGTTNSNNFQIEMFFDGRIRITLLGIAATDGLIGLSAGSGVPAGFAESDFSGYPGLVAHHFSFAPIASPQGRVTPFPVSITAKDANDLPIPAYDSTLTLTAAGSGGAVPLTPGSVSGFINGTWTGSVMLSAVGTNVVITANDGLGHTGSSNAFDVGAAGFDHFVWNPIAFPQTADTPFAVTVAAADFEGNPVASFAGTANLSALLGANSTIGSGTAAWAQPIYTYYHDERTQTIYPPAEVGAAGKITALALYVTTLPGQTMNAWTIRLKHTALANYGASPAWEGTGWTTVHQSNQTIAGTGWVSFVFSTPFQYDGTSSLLVDFSFNNTTYTTAGACRYTTAAANRTIYYYTDSGFGDPLTWSGTAAPAPLVSTAVPNVQLTIERAIPIRPAATAAFSGGVWTGTVSVPFAAGSVRLNATESGGRSGASNAFAVNAAPPGPGNGATIFAEDFESGVLGPVWAATGTGPYRTQVTTANGPHGGARHLTMDSASDGTYARNEATLTLNLAGRTGVMLKFWAVGFSDEGDGPPASPFTGGADFDGVAISADGATWWEVQALRTLTGAYAQFTVDLDAAIAAHGLSYNSAFKIRFNQYDNFAIATDGIGIDDILITAASVNPLTVTLPAQATEGAGALAGSVALPSTQPAAVIVALTSNAPAKLTVPASVTIPAGQLSANFTATVLDDAVLDGTKAVSVTAAAGGFTAGSASIQILDNETATLALNIPASTTEGAGTVQGAVSVSAPPSGILTIALVSGDPTAAQVPASVMMLPGETLAVFAITVVDDLKIDGTQTATITATLPGSAAVSRNITVADNENTNLTLSLANVTEGSTATGTVSISGTLTTALSVALSSNNAARLPIQSSVTIAAGATSATFPLTPVDNALTDGSASVTITASAPGFTNATGTCTVFDNEVHHLTVSAIASPQVANAPFSVTVNAVDVNGVTIAGFGSTLTFTASGTGGAVGVSPATATLAGGTWTGSLAITGLASNVVLTARDTPGHTGASNSFNVGVGALHHFAWNPIASPQGLGAPFAVAVTAQDSANNTVTTFTGTAALNCGPAAREVGTGTASWTQPIHTYWHDERTQTIYPPAEVGAAGKITALALYVTTAPGQTLNAWTIRLKHTALASYGATPAWEGAGWTTVHQSNQTITGTGWVSFVFSTPFQYDGASNLMVDFSYNNTSFTSAGACRYTAAATNRTIYYYTDSGYGDPLTWTGTSAPAPIVSTSVPNLRLQLERAVPLTPAVTAAFSNGVWTGPVAVGQAASGVTLAADNGSGATGESNGFNVAGIPLLTVSPASTLNASGNFGGPFAPSSIAYTLTNTGSGSLDWTAAKTAAWLSLSSAGGTLAPGATATVTATVAAAADTLAPGSYSDIITFTNTSNGAGNTTRAAALTVLVPDADHDGLPDAWEAAFGLDPFSASGENGALGNPDGDGLVNLLELAFGTDPRAAKGGAIAVSGATIVQHGLPTTQMQSTQTGADFRALFGRRKDYAALRLTYTVQFSADLVTWEASTAIPTVIASDAEIDAVTVPYPILLNGQKARFFRVQVGSL